jgi:hypothetical protein
MHINDDKRFVYLALPKTGSYSIHYFFGELQHPEPHLHHAGVRELATQYADYFKFAFVRNPWSKLVSIYHDFTLRRGKQYSGLVWMKEPLLSEFKDFEDFCRGLSASPWLQDVFFRPQSMFVTDVNGDSAVDFVGRFESLEDDFTQVCKILEIPLKKELAFANKGKYTKDYREYYNDETRKIVGEIYREDVKRFGYEF